MIVVGMERKNIPTKCGELEGKDQKECVIFYRTVVAFKSYPLEGNTLTPTELKKTKDLMDMYYTIKDNDQMKEVLASSLEDQPHTNPTPLQERDITPQNIQSTY